MGWNTIEQPEGADESEDVPAPRAGAHVYYVHSYYAAPEVDVRVLRTTRYGPPGAEVEFPAIIAHRATLAAQFHPEKSSAPGLRLIADWVDGLKTGTQGPGQRPNIDTPADGSGAHGADHVPPRQRGAQHRGPPETER